MTLYLTCLLASSALGALGVWMARGYALKRDWMDRPNDRSFHDRPTPRIGGIGMLLPVLIGGVLLGLTAPSDYHWLWSILPALGVAVLSFFDDRFNISRLIRFGGHGLCALSLMFLFRHSWVGAGLPVFGSLLPSALVAFFLFIWITGLTNAYNFMDGIDGIAAVQGIVAVTGWLTVFALDPAVSRHSATQELMLLALCGGLLGFLVLNWAPASIFMGDVGSTFLGFFLASIPFAAASHGMAFERAIEAGALFVWPFVFDTASTFSRRVFHREPIFDAHRTHLYQRLAATFSSRETGHRITSLIFGGLACAGLVLFWLPIALIPKLLVMILLWLALTGWTYWGRIIPANSTCELKGIKTSSSFTFPTDDKPTFPAFMPFNIYLSPPEITDVERRFVAEALASGFIAPVGPQLNAFEKELARYLGLPEIHAVNSGTAAIHLGLRALGVGPGDCVLSPDLTFIASVNPIRYLGAEPVLVDVSAENWAMDPRQAREAIRTLKREGRTVRAMVIVHAFGIPAPVEELVDIAREEGVLVLEDCAGAFGTRYGSSPVGVYGDASAFSFNGNKVLTTSSGGALFVRDPEMRKAARRWANQGRDPDVVGYAHETLGYNYKLSNICAAIGLGQLQTVTDRLDRKAAIFSHYKERLSGIAGVRFMPEPTYGRNNYWLSCLKVSTNGHAEELVTILRSKGIESAPMWNPMHSQGINQDLRSFGGEVSEEIYATHLSLPSGSALSEKQVDQVCAIVRDHLMPIRA